MDHPDHLKQGRLKGVPFSMVRARKLRVFHFQWYELVNYTNGLTVWPDGPRNNEPLFTSVMDFISI